MKSTVEQEFEKTGLLLRAKLLERLELRLQLGALYILGLILLMASFIWLPILWVLLATVLCQVAWFVKVNECEEELEELGEKFHVLRRTLADRK